MHAWVSPGEIALTLLVEQHPVWDCANDEESETNAGPRALISTDGGLTMLRALLVWWTARLAELLDVPYCHLVFTLPFMVRTVAAAFAHEELIALEEAARSLGASFTQRFLGVLVPAVLPSIVAGALMVFTLSVGEFNLTWMLHTPLTRTLPVGLADSYASMRLEIGSAYTLIFFAIVLPALWAMQWLATLLGPRPLAGAPR